MPENIRDLDLEPVPGLVCGSYVGWCVTSDRHAPRYRTGDALFTNKAVSPAMCLSESTRAAAQMARNPEGVRTPRAISISKVPRRARRSSQALAHPRLPEPQQRANP